MGGFMKILSSSRGSVSWKNLKTSILEVFEFIHKLLSALTGVVNLLSGGGQCSGDNDEQWAQFMTVAAIRDISRSCLDPNDFTVLNCIVKGHASLSSPSLLPPLFHVDEVAVVSSSSLEPVTNEDQPQSDDLYHSATESLPPCIILMDTVTEWLVAVDTSSKLQEPIRARGDMGGLVVRASDSRPEGLGSMPDATK
ncbi:hypothetical protein TNCV_4413311 [Trichonephila clavipes]|nr:hypothetical protein TNCV_4413311 [Trichonephila clavipes]